MLPILIGCACILVWLYFQYPYLAANFFTAIPASFHSHTNQMFENFYGGDHIQVFYYGWKLKENLLNGISPFIDPYTFAATGQENVDLMMGVQYVAIAFWGWLWGDVPGYNFAIFVFAPMVTFVGAFLLLRVVSTHTLACFFGALAITFVPYRWIQMSGGHSGGVIHMLLPYFFWGILRHRLKPKDRHGDLWAGLALFATTISDEHQGYYLILASMFIFVTWFCQDLFAGGKSFLLQSCTAFIWHWKYLILGLLFTLGYGLILDELVLSHADGSTKFSRTFREIENYSVPGKDFFSYTENNIGAILIWFLPMAAFALRRSPYLAFVVAFPFCCVTMFGLGDHWSQQYGLYELFYQLLPYFKYQRVPGKIFGVVTILLIILIVALLNYFKSRKYLAHVLVAALILQVFQFGYFLSSLGVEMSRMTWEPKKITDYMREHTSTKDIFLLVPATEGTGGRYTTLNYYLAYKTKRRFSSGYSGNPPSYFIKSRKFLTLFNDGTPDRQALEVAKAEGVTHMILAQEIAGYSQAKYLKKLICDESFCLFEFLYDPKILATLPNPGFTAQEEYRGYAGKWMRSHSDIPTWLNKDQVKGFRIVSTLPSPNHRPGQTTNYELVFWSRHDDFSLWLFEPGKPPREFAAPWLRQEDGFHIRFNISSPAFVLATKERWNLYDKGHFDDIEYGHFITDLRKVD